MADFVPETSTPTPAAGILTAANAVVALVITAQRVITHIASRAKKAWNKAERSHQRAAQLKAYRLRQKWKKGDERRLEIIGISAVARRRFQRAKQTHSLGRPQVPDYKPLSQVLKEALENLDTLYHPSTPPHLRCLALKRTEFWPYFVEAVYRGEYEAARAEEKIAASIYAEERTGRAFAIGPDSVRRTAGRVRKMRVQGVGRPDSPSILVSDFETWKRTGHLPEKTQKGGPAVFLRNRSRTRISDVM